MILVILRRMIQASKLKAEVYARVAQDPSATIQALLVVMSVCFAATVGFGGWSQPSNFLSIPLGLTLWTIWSACAHLLGTRWFGGSGTFWATMRSTGFAFSPGVLWIFARLPGLGVVIVYASLGLMLAAGVLAVRNSLGLRLSHGIAINTLIGLLIIAILLSFNH